MHARTHAYSKQMDVYRIDLGYVCSRFEGGGGGGGDSGLGPFLGVDFFSFLFEFGSMREWFCCCCSRFLRTSTCHTHRILAVAVAYNSYYARVVCGYYYYCYGSNMALALALVLAFA